MLNRKIDAHSKPQPSCFFSTIFSQLQLPVVSILYQQPLWAPTLTPASPACPLAMLENLTSLHKICFYYCYCSSSGAQLRGLQAMRQSTREGREKARAERKQRVETGSRAPLRAESQPPLVSGHCYSQPGLDRGHRLCTRSSFLRMYLPLSQLSRIEDDSLVNSADRLSS